MTMQTVGEQLDEKALAVPEGGELQQAGATAKEFAEIQAACVMARKFPRDESVAFAKLMKASQRPAFAEEATYEFPRGRKEDGSPNIVSGPSVNIAREAGRVWGNMRMGLRIIRDDAGSRLIRAECWDLETGAFEYAEDDFKKLIQRKVRGETIWTVPDERDLRELTNRRGAILVRNCILHMLPKDLIEDALFICAETLKDKSKTDPDGTRKRLIVNFQAFNVTPEMIAQRLGHPLASASPEEMVELQHIYTSIKDGNSTWKEYVTDEKAEPTTPGEQAAPTQTSKGAAVREKIKVKVGKKAEAEPTKPQSESAAQPPDPMLVDHFTTIREAATIEELSQILVSAEKDTRLSMIQVDQVYAAYRARRAEIERK